MVLIQNEEQARSLVDGEYDEELLSYLEKFDIFDNLIQFYSGKIPFCSDVSQYILSRIKEIVASLFVIHPYLGDGFGDKVARNDLFGAVEKCEPIDLQALGLYVMVLNDIVPQEILVNKRRSR